MKFFKYITGGRPMKKLGYAFWDHVDNKPVYYFEDLFDRIWMAQHKWACFRVRTKCPVSPPFAEGDIIRITFILK